MSGTGRANPNNLTSTVRAYTNAFENLQLQRGLQIDLLRARLTGKGINSLELQFLSWTVLVHVGEYPRWKDERRCEERPCPYEALNVSRMCRECVTKAHCVSTCPTRPKNPLQVDRPASSFACPGRRDCQRESITHSIRMNVQNLMSSLQA